MIEPIFALLLLYSGQPFTNPGGMFLNTATTLFSTHAACVSAGEALKREDFVRRVYCINRSTGQVWKIK